MDRLQIVKELVAEQLKAGHVVPSTSPWNSPIFTIQKKSGKWRFLHDLRVINAVMQDRGAVQPGLPSPVMIPEHSDLLIVDLKDCFFTIPLHPDDAEKFAFIVPAINNGDPSFPYRTDNSGTCTRHVESTVAKTKRGRNRQSSRMRCKSALCIELLARHGGSDLSTDHSTPIIIRH